MERRFVGCFRVEAEYAKQRRVRPTTIEDVCIELFLEKLRVDDSPSHPKMQLRLVQFEPRAHPDPWEERIPRWLRRRMARAKGRRRAISVRAVVHHQADPFPEMWRYLEPRADLSNLSTCANVLAIRGRLYRCQGATTRCLYGGRGRYCDERCYTHGEHRIVHEAMLYCCDEDLEEAEALLEDRFMNVARV